MYNVSAREGECEIEREREKEREGERENCDGSSYERTNVFCAEQNSAAALVSGSNPGNKYCEKS